MSSSAREGDTAESTRSGEDAYRPIRIHRKKFGSSNAALTCVVAPSVDVSSTIDDFGATEEEPTNANAVTAAASATSVKRAAMRATRVEDGRGSASRSASRTRAGESATLRARSGA